MDEARAKILEQQLDTIAGTTKKLEEQVNALVRILCRPKVAEALHLTITDEGNLKFPKGAYNSAYEHTMQREKQLRDAAREAAIDRLIREQKQRDQGETRRRG